MTLPRFEPEAFLKVIEAWAAQRVPENKRLGDVVSCEAIPENPPGKILRCNLRAQDAARTAD